MRRVCTLKADLSGLARSLKVQKGPRGQDFWRVEHSVAVLFGGTQLRARLQWYEGVSCNSFNMTMYHLTNNGYRINCARALSASFPTLSSKPIIYVELTKSVNSSHAWTLGFDLLPFVP